MTKLQDITPRRIAILKPSALGDIVHSLPVLSALRQRWPSAHITWVVNRGYESLICEHPELDGTIAVDRGAYRRGAISAVLTSLQLQRRLRQAKFDLVVDLQGLLRTGLMAWLSGAPCRVGFGNAREGATRFYTDVVDVPDAEQIHAVDRYWRIVEAFGAGQSEKRFVVPISVAAMQQTDELLRGLPRPWMMIAAGARWQTKRWPVDNFIELAQWTQRKFGGSAIFVGGTEDHALVEGKFNAFSALNLCGQTTLPVLAALLKRADIVVANDTGPLHLAAALDRPVIAPYTCTLVRKHGPFGQFHRTVSADVSCAGSYVRTCSHMSCMATLLSVRVMPKIEEILHEWKLRNSA